MLTYRGTIEYKFYKIPLTTKNSRQKATILLIRKKFLANLANHRGNFTKLSRNPRAYLLADLSF